MLSPVLKNIAILITYAWLSLSCKEEKINVDQKLAATREYYDSPGVIGAFMDPAAFGQYRWHATFKIKTLEGQILDETEYLTRNAKLSTETRILDWGCGMGWLAVRLAQQCRCRVTGLNISAVQLEQARKWAQQNHVAQWVKFDLYDGKKLPYEDSAFDVIFSQEALVNAPDKDLTYREIFRVLKPGGEFSVQDWYADAANKHWADLVKPIDEEHKSSLATMQDTAQTLKRIGFESVQNEDIRELAPGSLARAFPNQVFAAALKSGAFTVAFTSARKPRLP